MIARFGIVALALALSGCASTFKETHYFKSRSTQQGIPNYYRLTVDGYSFFSSSRYISGYFDEETINAYFNEYTQPAGAAIVPRATTPKPAAATAAKPPAQAATKAADAVDPVSPGVAGQKLVMLLSSNSDEIATQIGALAASKQFTASLAGLVARDQFNAADTAESRLTLEKSRARTTASLADQLVKGLADTAAAATARDSLLGFINALAPDLGYYGAFPSLDEAAKWLDANRSRLRGDQ